uniref:Uncharacterized protein n=1 Tax=Physcomitrium patens TaxID=3218 RepID=A0A2K1IVU8_PHYPA|nr:hypothetical protein PHYPA_025349 [Physcomitrium patens]
MCVSLYLYCVRVRICIVCKGLLNQGECTSVCNLGHQKSANFSFPIPRSRAPSDLVRRNSYKYLLLFPSVAQIVSPCYSLRLSECDIL